MSKRHSRGATRLAADQQELANLRDEIERLKAAAKARKKLEKEGQDQSNLLDELSNLHASSCSGFRSETADPNSQTASGHCRLVGNKSTSD